MNARAWWVVVVAELLLGGGVLLALWSRAPAATPIAAAAVAPPEPDANGLVALLTDYGSMDPYVGILKGAVLSANPEARIVDVTHDLPNFDVWAASYVLGQVAGEWPPGTTFVVVVDPGVGSGRRMIAAETFPDGRRYVAPDNGVLTEVLANAEAVRINALENAELARPGAESSTFHGRDWFGPIGGHLAAGVPLDEVGPAVEKVVGLPRRTPRWDGTRLTGSVLYCDHYGNILTNIPAALLDETGLRRGASLAVSFDSRAPVTVPWVRTYSDVPRGDWLLTTSNGPQCVEIAISYGSAATSLDVRPGMDLALRPIVEDGPS